MTLSDYEAKRELVSKICNEFSRLQEPIDFKALAESVGFKHSIARLKAMYKNFKKNGYPSTFSDVLVMEEQDILAEICPECDGFGYVNLPDKCSKCNGTGKN